MLRIVTFVAERATRVLVAARAPCVSSELPAPIVTAAAAAARVTNAPRVRARSSGSALPWLWMSDIGLPPFSCRLTVSDREPLCEPYATRLKAAPDEHVQMFRAEDIHVVVVGGQTGAMWKM